MTESKLHAFVARAEEALLGRTLTGRLLARDVLDSNGNVLFSAGSEIDHPMLDAAREAGLLEELAHAAEPATSDTELEDFLWWRKHRREHDAHHPDHGHE